MQAANWVEIATTSLPYTEFSWTTNESDSLQEETEGALLLKSPATQHRYGPLTYGWYQTLEQNSETEGFEQLLTAATVTGVSPEVLDVLRSGQPETTTIVTAGRYTEVFRMERKYDDGPPENEQVAAGALAEAADRHELRDPFENVANEVPYSVEELKSTSARLNKTIPDTVLEHVAQTDLDGKVTTFPDRQH